MKQETLDSLKEVRAKSPAFMQEYFDDIQILADALVAEKEGRLSKDDPEYKRAQQIGRSAMDVVDAFSEAYFQIGVKESTLTEAKETLTQEWTKIVEPRAAKNAYIALSIKFANHRTGNFANKLTDGKIGEILKAAKQAGANINVHVVTDENAVKEKVEEITSKAEETTTH